MPQLTERWIAVSLLLQEYADAIDRADIGALVALFTEDGIWEHGPGTVRRGHTEITTHLQHVSPRYHRTSHHIGPPVVSGAGADAVPLRVYAYFMAVHQLNDGSCYSAYGRYVDDLVEHEEGLLISHHRIVAHVVVGTDESRYEFLKRHEVGQAYSMNTLA
jgi:ketosteroid isomerase-like protein